MTRLAVEIRFAPCSVTELLAVRHALPIVDHDDGLTWHESFAAGAWLVGGQGARITLGHDGADVGSVVCTVARGAWFYADAIVATSDLKVIRVGQPVSIDARGIRRDDNELTHVRRHRLVQLQAIAVLLDREQPVYADARITRVTELTARAPYRTKSALRPTKDEREMIELRRRVAAAGPGANIGAITEAYRRELGYRRETIAELAA